MPVDAARAKSVFLSASDIADPAERAAYLDRECGDDADLRARVEALLRADAPLPEPGLADATGTFDPDAPPAGPTKPTADYSGRDEKVGSVLAGRYKLVEEIGEGGMGSVYMAQQTEPVKRAVAVKVIKAGMDSKAVLARFEAERQALALMDHPNIARVLDAGTTEGGRPFFVMELVKGVPITQFCDERKLPPRERLGLFIQVCQAIQHAHQKGVIHRDVKPSNVLVAMYDDRPVPKVIDFGVAKAAGQSLTDRTLMTGFGAVVGTPEYMSPEQANLNNLDVDTRADVYSLGVLLYELLTGTTPVDRKSLGKAALLEVLRIVREVEALRPSAKLSTIDTLPTVAANRGTEPAKLSRLMKGELDWVVMKALEKDRARRYETASAFALDVQRYLADEPVQACRPAAGYKLRKFARRNRVAVAAAAAVAAAVLVGTALTAWQAVRATQAEAAETRQRAAAEGAADEEKKAKDKAQEERDRALAAERRMAAALERERHTAYAHAIALAYREVLANEVGRALQLLGECPEDLRNWEWRYVRRLCNAEQTAFRDHTNEVSGLAFSPDGTRVLSSSRAEAWIWDAVTGEKLVAIPRQGSGWGRGVAYSPDHKRVALAGFRVVTIHDVADGKLLTRLDAHESLVADVAFSPDGRRLATASGAVAGGGRPRGGEIKIWEVATGKLLHSFADLPHSATSVAFSADGKRVAAGTGDLYILGGGEDPKANYGQVRVWDVESGKLVHTLLGHTFWVTGVAFSADGKRLASVGGDETVRLWDLEAGREALVLRGHVGWVRAVAFNPKGDRLATAGDDRVVRVWDAAVGREVNRLRGHVSPVHALAFSPDGTRLASAAGQRAKGGEVRVWDVAANQQAREIRDHKMSVKALAFSPDSKLLASVTSTYYYGDAVVRDVPTGRPRTRIEGTHGFLGVAFQPDGSAVAAAGGLGVHLWDPNRDGPARLLPHNHGQVGGGSGMAVEGIAYSPDGKKLAAAGSSGVTVWEAASGRVLLKFRAHPLLNTANYENLVAFSPDGKKLATAARGGIHRGKVDGVEKTERLTPEVKVWDAETGKELLKIPRGGYGLAFSPDGARIASGNADHTVSVQDAADGTVLLTLRGHGAPIDGLAFSRDGRRIVTAGTDHLVKIWDATTGQEVLTLRGHTQPVVGVSFSPDGRWLASVSSTFDKPGPIMLWDGGAVGP